MSKKYTYISLLYRNDRKVTERIGFDDENFKKITVGKGCHSFAQESGSIVITLEDVIFAKISSTASSLSVGELLIDDRKEKKEYDETFNIELLFDNGAAETIKDISIKYKSYTTNWQPKNDFVIRLMNEHSEMFFFNTKDVIYIKYTSCQSSLNIY